MMVAGDINVCDIGGVVVSRIPLLCRGIADQQVGLLSGNGVRSETKTAPGVPESLLPTSIQNRKPEAYPSPPIRKGGLMRVPVFSDASCTDLTFAPLVRGEAR